MRELSLQEPHPAGTAAGEHGPVIFVPVGKALDELTALLHDGQVGGEVGVEHIVEAHGLQRRHHALRRGKLGVQAHDKTLPRPPAPPVRPVPR